ncbi:hypothetical protein [Gorillibacterium sp. sgz5001074]|uniref:hypothetical protein n=1 Tax=Gorillibacterium sp. sgz5001074 TaxID=3446695 RepID=UPI003F672DF5
MPREIETEDAILKLREMFNEYALDEYQPFFDALIQDHDRMGAELFKIKLEAIGHGKDAA